MKKNRPASAAVSSLPERIRRLDAVMGVVENAVVVGGGRFVRRGHKNARARVPGGGTEVEVCIRPHVETEDEAHVRMCQGRKKRSP